MNHLFPRRFFFSHIKNSDDSSYFLNLCIFDTSVISLLRENIKKFSELKSIGFLSCAMEDRFLHAVVLNLDENKLTSAIPVDSKELLEVCNRTMRLSDKLVDTGGKKCLVQKRVNSCEGSEIYYGMNDILFHGDFIELDREDWLINERNEKEGPGSDMSVFLYGVDGTTCINLLNNSIAIRGELNEEVKKSGNFFRKKVVNRNVKEFTDFSYDVLVKKDGKYYSAYSNDIGNIFSSEFKDKVNYFNKYLLNINDYYQKNTYYLDNSLESLNFSLKKSDNNLFSFTPSMVLNRNVNDIEGLVEGTESFFWENFNQSPALWDRQYKRQNLVEKAFSSKGDFKEQRLSAILMVAQTILGDDVEKYAYQNKRKYGPLSGKNVFAYYLIQRLKDSDLAPNEDLWKLIAPYAKKVGYLKITESKIFESFKVKFNYPEMIIKYVVERGGNFLSGSIANSEVEGSAHSTGYRAFRSGFIPLVRKLVEDSDTQLEVYGDRGDLSHYDEVVFCGKSDGVLADLNKMNLQIILNIILDELLDKLTVGGTLTSFKELPLLPLKASDIKLNEQLLKLPEVISVRYKQKVLEAHVSKYGKNKDKDTDTLDKEVNQACAQSSFKL